ncbi:MAG: hypothetical protein CSA58_05555 [Micrococcales bacterium]|nr:MAG: hypothetical protein CSA58_05555 [Micrococcales bacterium]
MSDDQAALEAVTGAYPGATVRDGYLVVDLDDSVPSAAASAEAVEAHGTLAEASGYSADMKKLDLDGIGYGWVDLDTMGDLAKSSGALDDSSVPLDTGNLNKLRGSLVGGIALRSDGLQMRALGLGLADDLVVDMGKASQVNELPADSWLAFGLSGLPAALTKAYQDDPTLGGADESLQSMADRYGLRLPEDVARLLGNDLAVGVAGTPSFNDPSIQARFGGADADLLNTIADDVPDYDSSMLDITDRGDAVTIEYGNPGRGRLGEDPRFTKAVPDMDKAHAVMFMDLQAVNKLADSPVQGDLGYLGASAAVDGDQAEIAANWILE